MNITNYLIQAYKENLTKRYEAFKKSLSSENFVPDANEVWKMYGIAFDENTGAYQLVKDLLDIERFDSTGKLNDLERYLDHINAMLSDYGTAYVSGLKKQTLQQN